MNSQVYCINGIRINVSEVMDAIEEMVSPLLANLPEDENSVEATLQVNDNGWLFHTGDPSYIQDFQGYFGQSTIFPDLGRTLTECELEQAACSMLETALSEYWDNSPDAFLTRESLEGDDWVSQYDSQAIEGVLESIGVSLDDMTAVHTLVGDGEYLQVWVTDDCAPYRDSAEFWRVY
jgi:hypothetical protein